MVENEARAREVTSYRAHQKRENAAASISGMRGSLEQMMSQLKTTGRKDFPLIVKADVQGSLESDPGIAGENSAPMKSPRASCMRASAASRNPT